MLEVLIAIITFSFLIILHEFGHFIVAKKFGVKVEEFGLGLPPRLFGKKIGETIFSLNLIPFGGFVRMYGEEENIKNPQSFTGKPVWQRALIIVAGVAAFWILAVVLLSIVFRMGAPIAVGDEEYDNLTDIKVQIISVVPGSPAEKAGIRIGDIIKGLQITNYKLQITKVKEVQEFTNLHKGEKIVLTVERGKEVFDLALVPRVEPPKDEGAMGVALARTAIKSFPWWQAPVKGAEATINLTYTIIVTAGQILGDLVRGQPLAPEARIIGPVGIFSLIGDSAQLGIVYFLKFIAIIAIHLAIINLLPIPALDGGKLLFLSIEAVRGKPISQKTEQSITGIFFFLLIALMIFVTIKDIIRLF